MDETASYACPSCGETIETAVDPSAGALQEYVEDCPVCCRPNLIRVAYDREGEAVITVRPDDA